MVAGVVVPPHDAAEAEFEMDGSAREIALAWASEVFSRVSKHTPEDAIRACRLIIANDAHSAHIARDMLNTINAFLQEARATGGAA